MWTTSLTSTASEGQLDVIYSVQESWRYGPDQDLLTCKHIKGILTAEDSVAFSQEERAIDEATSCGDGTSCTLACDGGTSNACSVSYAIKKLAMPEQLAPHNKYLHATFQPDGDGLPETLTSHSVQAVVIEGDIPLSAKETIKLPEYIPFMILRDPPGSLSSSSWTKETSSTLSLSVEMEDSGTYMLGANVVGGSYSKTDVKAGFSWGPQGSATILAGESDLKLTTGGDDEWSKSKVVSQGNEVHISTEVTYSTSGYAGADGAASDLFVVPSLSLLTLRTLPIYFDSEMCFAKEGAETTKWVLLEDEGNVDDVLQNNLEAIKTLDATGSLKYSNDGDLDVKQTKADMRKQVNAAFEDAKWNAVTAHTTFDILYTRIPQLKDRCTEYRMVFDQCPGDFSLSHIIDDDVCP